MNTATTPTIVGDSLSTSIPTETTAEANICSLDSESLGQYVASVAVGILSKAEALRPYYEELWRRFDALQDGETINGCATRTEYCEKILHRSIRSVQYMIYGRTPKPTQSDEGADVKRWYKFVDAADNGDADARRLLDEVNAENMGMEDAYIQWLELSGNTTIADDTSDFDAYVNPPEKETSEFGAVRGTSPNDINSFGGTRRKDYYSHEYVGGGDGTGETSTVMEDESVGCGCEEDESCQQCQGKFPRPQAEPTDEELLEANDDDAPMTAEEVQQQQWESERSTLEQILRPTNFAVQIGKRDSGYRVTFKFPTSDAVTAFNKMVARAAATQSAVDDTEEKVTAAAEKAMRKLWAEVHPDAVRALSLDERTEAAKKWYTELVKK